MVLAAGGLSMEMKAAHDDASVLLVIGSVLASILHLDPAPELLIVLPLAHGCVDRI
jgi:hypothetical protein